MILEQELWPAGRAEERPASSQDKRRTMGVALPVHALHDGYSDLVYVMLPIWQAEFALSYAAVGLLRSVLSGAMAAFQIPAGLLAERIGAATVLAAGTGIAGLCFCLIGWSSGYAFVATALFLAGIGSSAQHPIGSALVARAFAGPRSLAAIGTYNFSGDIGKVLFPATATLLMLFLPWRTTVALLGSVGIAAAAAIFLLLPRTGAASRTGEERGEDRRVFRTGEPTGFPLLLVIGMIDNATRTAFLTFLPFLLREKGAELPTIGLALTLAFVGGAAGKLVCTFVGMRIGAFATVILTESMTAIGIFVLLLVPLAAALPLIPLVGIALSGTSSVLYGSVAHLVSPAARTRAFAVFYTGTIGCGTLAPFGYGFASDTLGISATLAVIAAVAATTLPLAVALRGSLRRASEEGV
jgi:FSR family fosmidomycin resistance protein-like MFS transporter